MCHQPTAAGSFQPEIGAFCSARMAGDPILHHRRSMSRQAPTLAADADKFKADMASLGAARCVWIEILSRLLSRTMFLDRDSKSIIRSRRRHTTEPIADMTAVRSGW